ncbi:MAG: peptide chain release factor 1, partial [Frankiales bacterium]|nr:peptide chain release factor 1 [Frankiales bacterium]
MSESLDDLLREHAELEQELADPAIHADAGRARKLGRRYAELAPIVELARQIEAAGSDLEVAREYARDDASFAQEAVALETLIEDLNADLRGHLLPKDPNDDKDVILEIKAGEGGDESALFAGDLLRMYLRYAERQGWKTETLDATESDLGGYKDVSVAVKTRGSSAPPWSRL